MKRIYVMLIIAFAYNCSIMHTMRASQELSKADCYKILEISANANPQEIKKAYKKLCLRYHPDKNPGNENVIAIFHKLKPAFEILYKESSPEFLKTNTGLAFEQIFKMQHTIRSINQHLQAYPGMFSTNFVEQQMPTDLNENNYHKQFEFQKNLLNQIKKEVAQLPKKAKIQLPKLNGVTINCAQVMVILAEIQKKYQENGFSISLPNPVGLTIHQAEEFYKDRIEHIEILHKMKNIIDKNKDYFHPNAIAIISRIEFTAHAQEQLHQVNKMVADKEEEVRKINNVFEDIKHVWNEYGVTVTLPEAKHLTLDKAREIYKDHRYFVECLQNIRNAINKNKFSAQFSRTIPTNLKSSEEAKQTLDMINKEVERLKIQEQKAKQQAEFGQSYRQLKNTIQTDESYISPELTNKTVQYLALMDEASDHDDNVIKASHMISQELDREIQINKVKKIQKLYDHANRYQSIATFGLYPSLKTKSQANLNTTLNNIEQLKKDKNAKELNCYINTNLKQAEKDKIKAQSAASATIVAGLGAATTITGLAAYCYYKNK